MSEYLGNDVEAVLFDHDDTLVSSYRVKWDEHKHIMRTHYGREVTDDEIRLHYGKPMRTLIGLLYQTDDIDTALELLRACYDDFPKKLFSSTIPTLKAIRESGRKIGVITAHNRHGFERDLDMVGLPRELLDYTQTEDDTPYHKPDQRVFNPAKQWLESFGIAPQNVVYVGDGMHDRHAAHDAGLQFIGVETGLVTAEEFSAAGIVCVSSLAKLVKARSA